ncbi:hypothetical protein R0G64_32285, partial [Pseudomonas otitidis]|nr:hypothetical protein [Pseudomonas otitidis]
ANGIPRGKLLHRDELLAIYENGRPLPSSILSLTLQGGLRAAVGVALLVQQVELQLHRHHRVVAVGLEPV